METLERSRVCRLCGKHAGITIDIFDKRGNHVKKINSVLPILVHEMDLLPKHICHPCNYKLQEFHKFYEDCLKTDANLKGQLSWMRGSVERAEVGVPMVQINNLMIKPEPPDYDGQDTTEGILHSETFTNYVQNNCTAYPERILPSSGTKCSHCGCYRGNRNRVNNKIAKTNAKTRAARHSKEKNNNGQFTSRDTIRRNLFATEIFGEKSPRIQTEIPICNIPREMMGDEAAANALDSNVRLERLGRRRNGGRVASHLKISDDTNKMAARTLRSRKTRVTHPSHAVSAPDVIIMSSGKSESKDIVGTVSNDFGALEIKLEASEDFERSLRPRVEAIDYSDTKRKNPMARTTARKRKRSFDDHLNTKVQRKIDKDLSTYVKSTKFVDPTIVIKVEPEEFTESLSFPKPNQNSETSSFPKPNRHSKTSSFPKPNEHSKTSSFPNPNQNSKTPISSRNAKKKRSKIVFGDFLTTSIIDKMSSGGNFNGSKSRVSDRSRVKARGASRGRNLKKNRVYASPYLRSQRGHLRNGKLTKFNSIEEKPKKIQSSNVPHGILLESIKHETREINERPTQIIFKHRDCLMCNSRFASVELYMLHDCYTN